MFSPGSMSHCIYVLPSVYTVLLKGINLYWLGLRYVGIVLQPLIPKFKADLPQVFTILILILFYRLEICQKIYTTGFSGKKFYTLKVSKFREKKRNSVNALTSVILVALLLEFN